MPDEKRPRKKLSPPDPERDKELRQMIQEDIDEQRKAIEAIRRKMN
ncbi:hypothetical protein ACVOMS_35730 (plasmid) [Bradyrhizobium guangxiense]